MTDATETIKFTYTFKDEDGILHKVKNQIKKDCVKSNELCEMFVDFMTSAGYSEQNIWDYFKCE